MPSFLRNTWTRLRAVLTLLILPLICLSIPLAAWADSAPAAPDLATTILALWNAIQSHAGTAMILMLVFQFLRTNEAVGILSKISGKWLQVVIAVISVISGMLTGWATGTPLGTAAINALFNAGGAMLIYQAIASINASVNDPAPPAAPPAAS